MSEVWPDSLPGFILKSWSYKKKSSILKSEMEVGPPKRRRRTTAEMSVCNGTLELTAAQFEIFREFLEVNLYGGIKPFMWPDFIAGEPREVRLSIDTGGDLYSVKQSGKNSFKVSMTVEVHP